MMSMRVINSVRHNSRLSRWWGFIRQLILSTDRPGSDHGFFAETHHIVPAPPTLLTCSYPLVAQSTRMHASIDE